MKTLFTALALMISASSFAQICSFKEELLYKQKDGSFKIAHAVSGESFNLATGEHLTGNGSVYQTNCLKHGNYTGFLGKWEDIKFCYNVVARNNLLVWNLDNGQRGVFSDARAVGYPQGTMHSDEAEKSNYTAFFPVGKNYYLGLVLSYCK